MILDDDFDNKEEPEELFERLRIIIDKGQEQLRVDKFIMQRTENATRNKIQNAIANGLVFVNNKEVKANFKVKGGDELVVYDYKNPEPEDIKAEKLDLNVVFEDDDILLIDKAVGMVVHPGSGNYSGTLLNGVAHHLQSTNPNINHESLARFGMVHRIDKNTSGLIVLAKTPEAIKVLSKQFFDHIVHRRYIALVWGDLKEDKGTITGHIGRHQRMRKLFTVYPDGDFGKEAVTHYKVLERFNYVTLVECRLETGRTHQIRVHMKHLGHPLFSDETYGGDYIVKGTVYTKYKQFVDNCFKLCPRQALHAAELGFKHPNGTDMKWSLPLPSDMEQVIEKWRQYIVFKKLEPED